MTSSLTSRSLDRYPSSKAHAGEVDRQSNVEEERPIEVSCRAISFMFWSGATTKIVAYILFRHKCKYITNLSIEILLNGPKDPRFRILIGFKILLLIS